MGVQFNITDEKQKMKPHLKPVEERRKRFSKERAYTLASIGVTSNVEQNKPVNMCASDTSSANVGAKHH